MRRPNTDTIRKPDFLVYAFQVMDQNTRPNNSVIRSSETVAGHTANRLVLTI